jgi:N-methylhydantoinase A/oxoprolinase/acetone carboxylase beta subunit
MAILLGVDTGGTYTDAVILDDARPPAEAVLAKAKSLTTRGDLSLGVGRAVRKALADSGVPPGQIALASLSTTLATNALVEGRGEPVALVFIGFGEADFARSGLAEALGPDPLIRVAGGHRPSGEPAAPLDLAALAEAAAHATPQVTGFAIASYFSVRNPEHEIAARDAIRARTGLPVTCSHELSSKVGGPKRALTTLLNARLVGLIDRLIRATEGLLAETGVKAPLMVVRGDGSLVSAAFARNRPIETILSGPAASIVGASFLTGAPDAVVSDIGGTTTDVAILSAGRPRLDPEGAMVGGWRTMVEAVAMATHGLGGDSEVAILTDGLTARLRLGPRRIVPLSLLAMDHPEVLDALRAQFDRPRSTDTDARFLLGHATSAPHAAPEGPEAEILARLANGPAPLDEIAPSRPARAAAGRLVARGLAIHSGFTPSDAAHVLGLQGDWSVDAARLGATLMARQRDGAGRAVAPDAEAFARMTIAALHRRSAEAVLETALREDGYDAALAQSPLAAAALEGRRCLLRPQLALQVPLIGLGASAPTYYPAVAAMLEAAPVIPAHADVANAVGAVAGRVSVALRLTISQPQAGTFRLHLADGPRDFNTYDKAEAAALATLRADAAAAAAEAGAEDAELHESIVKREAEVEGAAMMVETEITVEASGRPRLAHIQDL